MVFCRECGQPMSDTDKFCERCGTKTARAAADQSPVVSPEASGPAVPVSEERAMLISSGVRLLPLVGLGAGILALVAIFTPWTGVRAPVAGISAEATAWDMVINAKIMGKEYGREAYACLALSGTIVILVGSLLALATPKAKVPWGILGIAIGGLLSAASALWALSAIDTGTMLGVTVTYGFGLYLALVGGIVAFVVGVIGLLSDENRRNALTDILKNVGFSEPVIGRRQTAVTSMVAIALIGCAVALAGLLTPWDVMTTYRGSSRTYSAWNWIMHAGSLDPQVYHWFGLVGICVVCVGALFALAVPRLRLCWLTVVVGAALALVGVVWSFVAPKFALVPQGTYRLAFGYGIYLTLAGSIIAVLAGLVSLVMLTEFYNRRASHSP